MKKNKILEIIKIYLLLFVIFYLSTFLSPFNLLSGKSPNWLLLFYWIFYLVILPVGSAYYLPFYLNKKTNINLKKLFILNFITVFFLLFLFIELGSFFYM